MSTTTANISATYGTLLTRDEILRRSFQLAGVLEASQQPSGNDLAMAADFLNAILDSLQADGIMTRSVVLTTGTLTSGTATFTPTAGTMDVIGNAAIVVSSVDSPVYPMNLSEWMAIVDKTTQGRPTRYYLHRAEALTVYLHPVPDTAYSFRYNRVKLGADVTAGSNTLDLEQYWLLYVFHAVAHLVALAKSRDVQFCGYLNSKAEKLKEACLARNRKPGPGQVHLSHRTPTW